MFTTPYSQYIDIQEHWLDGLALRIYGISWIDDVWLFEDDEVRLRDTVVQYNDFITFYDMKFVPSKCHHYVLNDNTDANTPITLTDYDGISEPIEVISINKPFRCLGAFLTLELKWEETVNTDVVKLKEFGRLLSKRWSPACITAKLVNTNGATSISYALPLAELKPKHINKLQGLLIKPVKRDGRHSVFAPYKAYTLPVSAGGYGLVNVSSMHKAAKVAFAQRLLNSKYWFGAVTSQMHLLDLHRSTGGVHYPLEHNFSGWKKWRKPIYPPYFHTAHKVNAEIGIDIMPRDNWCLEDISISTFFRCVVGDLEMTDAINILKDHGLVRMRDVSPWFVPCNSIFDVSICDLTKSIISGTIINCNSVVSIPVFDGIEKLSGIGDSRIKRIRSSIINGCINIAGSKVPESFIPIAIRCRREYQRARIKSFPTTADTTLLLGSDGTKKDKHAAFAVVNSMGETVIAGRIGGRATSQRGAFGLLFAAGLADGPTRIVADPKFIIRTIQMCREGKIKPNKILKTNNRSIIRNTVCLLHEHTTIEWVEGHQDNSTEIEAVINRAADKQVKLANTDRARVVQECWDFTDPFYVLWKGDLYEGDLRKKTYNECVQIDVETFQSMDKNVRYRLKDCWKEQLKKTNEYLWSTFRFKLITGTLPTYSRMARSLPDVFGSLRCPCCENSVETDAHLFLECVAFTQDRLDVWNVIIDMLAMATGKGRALVKQQVPNWISNSDEQHGLWFIGCPPLSVKNWVSNHCDKELQITIWNSCFNVTINAVHDIWISRCDLNRRKGRLVMDLVGNVDENRELEAHLSAWGDLFEHLL